MTEPVHRIPSPAIKHSPEQKHERRNAHLSLVQLIEKIRMEKWLVGEPNAQGGRLVFWNPRYSGALRSK